MSWNSLISFRLRIPSITFYSKRAETFKKKEGDKHEVTPGRHSVCFVSLLTLGMNLVIFV